MAKTEADLGAELEARIKRDADQRRLCRTIRKTEMAIQECAEIAKQKKKELDFLRRHLLALTLAPLQGEFKFDADAEPAAVDEETGEVTNG